MYPEMNLTPESLSGFMSLPPMTGRDTDTLSGTEMFLAVLYLHETLP